MLVFSEAVHLIFVYRVQTSARALGNVPSDWTKIWHYVSVRDVLSDLIRRAVQIYQKGIYLRQQCTDLPPLL